MTNCDANAADFSGEVFRLNVEIVAARDIVTRPFGLTSSRCQVLGAIEATGNGTVSELARKIGISRQAVQRIVTEMVEEGTLALLENPHHQRAKRVTMTEACRLSFMAVAAEWEAITECIAHRLGVDNVAAATRHISELRDEFRHWRFAHKKGT